MEQTQELTVEALAEQVRRQCVDIMGKCAAGRAMEAGQLTAILCQRMADIVQGAKMAQELAEGADLASLEAYRDKPGIPE